MELLNKWIKNSSHGPLTDEEIFDRINNSKSRLLREIADVIDEEKSKDAEFTKLHRSTESVYLYVCSVCTHELGSINLPEFCYKCGSKFI